MIMKEEKTVTDYIKILIVEDEEPIAKLIRFSLSKVGYECTCVYDGIAAADILSVENFDLIILDIMLPGLNGYDVLEYAKNVEVPVIFLTAMGNTAQKVKGLRAGAEDYIVKPFEILELQARVETVLRRYNKAQRYLSMHDVTIDTSSRTVTQNGENVELTFKEYDLLVLFLRNPNRALYRETIYEQVWGGEMSPASRTVDIHILRLKKKLHWEDKIQTVYKIGYRLEDK